MDLGKTLLEASRKYSQVPDSHFSDVLLGVVTQVDPLKIKIGDKLVLQESNLILSAFVQETWINIPTTNGEEGVDGVFMHRHEINAETELANDGQGADHKHAIKVFTEYALPKILLWRGLLVGDEVYLLRIAKGQSYFVIQRKQGITNENGG